MSEPVFRKSVVVALVGLALVSVTFAMLTGNMQPSAGRPESSQPDSYSTSAVGHAALVALLEELGHTVHQSRRQAMHVTDPGAVLVLLEPQPWDSEGLTQSLEDLTKTATRLVLVLPKWWAEEDPENPAWVSLVRWLPMERINDLLTSVGIEARVLRPARPPTAWTGGPDDAQPELSHPQLLTKADLQPVVSSSAGVLVGLKRLERYGNPLELVVVSDPDLISTHGLARGENALVAVDALTLLKDDSPLIIDETQHGHGLTSHLAAELLRFPLVIGLIHVVLTCLIVLWAGLARFGPPTPAPSRRPSGKRALIENTAQLLVGAGQHGFLLKRYFELTVNRVGAAFHLPAGLDEAERHRRLAAMARRRGLADDPLTLTQELRETSLIEVAGHREGEADSLPSGSGPRRSRRALALASRIHQWHEDMLHGS